MTQTAYIFFGTPLKPVKITSRSAKRFVAALNDVVNQKYKKLVVSITCEGGYCDDGLSMYHALRQVAETIDVHTHAVLDCTSMAGILHMAGDKRTYAPATILGLHAASKNDEVDPAYNTRMAEVYKDRAGWGDKEVKEMFSSTDLELPTLDELVKLKVVTHAQPVHIAYSLATHTIN